MPSYVLDPPYLREMEGAGENLPTRTDENGNIVFQYRHVFSGPTLVSGPEGDQPTWDFAGLAFATSADAPYDRVSRILESASDPSGTSIYQNRVVDVSYTLEDGTLYYRQQYTYSGAGQGYISSERVTGSILDNLFYDARVDDYDPQGRLKHQTFYDDANNVLMEADYAFQASGGWATVESDYVPDANGQMTLDHQIYTEADGSLYVHVVYHWVNGFAHTYNTWDEVTAEGFAARVDHYGWPNHIVQQEFLDSNDGLLMTIDYTYGGVRGLAIIETSNYGAALDGQDYWRVIDHYSADSAGVKWREYDMRDGSHLIEATFQNQSLHSTNLGSGSSNPDDTFILFGDGDLVSFWGEFGVDTIYNFQFATPENPGGARLTFDSSLFSYLDAVRSAATITGDGTDITITAASGDEVILKAVLQTGLGIDDVLNSNSVSIIGAVAAFQKETSTAMPWLGDDGAQVLGGSLVGDCLATGHAADLWF